MLFNWLELNTEADGNLKLVVNPLQWDYFTSSFGGWGGQRRGGATEEVVWFHPWGSMVVHDLRWIFSFGIHACYHSACVYNDLDCVEWTPQEDFVFYNRGGDINPDIDNIDTSIGICIKLILEGLQSSLTHSYWWYWAYIYWSDTGFCSLAHPSFTTNASISTKKAIQKVYINDLSPLSSNANVVLASLYIFQSTISITRMVFLLQDKAWQPSLSANQKLFPTI